MIKRSRGPDVVEATLGWPNEKWFCRQTFHARGLRKGLCGMRCTILFKTNFLTVWTSVTCWCKECIEHVPVHSTIYRGGSSFTVLEETCPNQTTGRYCGGMKKKSIIILGFFCSLFLRIFEVTWILWKLPSLNRILTMFRISWFNYMCFRAS